MNSSIDLYSDTEQEEEQEEEEEEDNPAMSSHVQPTAKTQTKMQKVEAKKARSNDFLPTLV